MLAIVLAPASFVAALALTWAAPAAPAPGQTTAAPAALAPGQPGPPAESEAPAETSPAPVKPTPVKPTPVAETAAPAPAVDEAAWGAIEGRQVVIETSGGPVQGELADSKGDAVVVVLDDGSVKTVPKATAKSVRVVKAPPAEPSPKESMAALDTTDDEAQPGDEAKPEDEAEDEELTKGQERRKKRREEREHAILGAFTMQGATYTHWRGDGVNAGHASYAMDFGLGANFSPKFGLYAIAGGLLGAKIDDKSIKANYGHVAALFVFGGKYYYSTVGAGVAFSRLRFEDNTLQKDRGLAMPFKLMAKIPLPKKLYIGIGLTYEFAALRGFSRFVNGIGGQIVFGRW